jgi:hypothetical protein
MTFRRFLCPLPGFFLLALLGMSMQSGAQNLRSHPNNAWDTGEFLRYRVYYNSLLTGNVTAGEATIEVKNTSRRFFGREVWQIEAHGRSKGAFNWFFKVKNRYESFVDKQAVIPYLFVRRTREGSYVKDDDVYFYPQQRLAVSKTARKPVPDNVHDFVSALYFMRTLSVDDFDKDGNYFIDFFLDDSVYNSKIVFLGREEIRTSMGTFRCLKIAPMMATGNVFADAYPMFVWVTDDENHLPLLAESKVIVGSVKMELVEARNLKNPMKARLKE